ncbi:MAG: ABC transporter substrate-binding protein [Gemmobacter sp.]
MWRLFAVLMALGGAAQAEAVRIGTDPGFPPYVSMRGDRIVGMDRDVMDEVCRRAALDCTWARVAFDDLIPALRAGQIDVAIAGMANSPSRQRLVDFSTPYNIAKGASYYAGVPGAPEPRGARIGVKAGTIHAEHLAATGRKARAFRTEAAALDAVIAGEIDLYFGSNSYLLSVRDSDRRGWEILYQEDVALGSAAIALRKGERGLMAKVNAALDAMQRDGTLARLERNWFK